MLASHGIEFLTRLYPVAMAGRPRWLSGEVVSQSVCAVVSITVLVGVKSDKALSKSAPPLSCLCEKRAYRNRKR